jgi:CHC2 zinc finger
MPSLDYAAIKREIPLSDLLNYLGWSAIWSCQGQSRGGCPIHKSERALSRSFCVNGDGWYCHRCKRGGDQISLWMELHGGDAAQAAVAMCNALARPIYYKRRSSWKNRNGEEER